MSRKPWLSIGSALVVLAFATGCAAPSAGPVERRPPQPTAGTPTPSTKKVDPVIVERLQRVMIPLAAKMNNPRSADKIRVGIMDRTSTRPARGVASST